VPAVEFEPTNRSGEKGSRVKIPRGPAAVKEESSEKKPLGNREGMRVMTLEPEDLPVLLTP
jgi:hypothetical protein